MKLTPQWFVISDTHFGHKKIAEYENRPENFGDVIVERWNSVVGKDDSVLHLGDLMLCGFEQANGYCSRLNGHKYLILGNHDSESESKYTRLGFTVVERIYKVFMNSEGGYDVLFTHEPVLNMPASWWNVHGHIHSGTHREFPTTKHHLNMSVEAINYTPVRVYDLLAKMKHERVG